MDAETWVLPVEALEWGFATGIIKASETNKAAASARKALFNMVKNMVQVPASPVSSKEPEPEPASNPEPEPTSGSDFESKPKENKPVKFMAALFR